MIRVVVYIDGNKRGRVSFTCYGGIQDFIEKMEDSNPLIELMDINYDSYVFIPKEQYLIEAWEIDD